MRVFSCKIDNSVLNLMSLEFIFMNNQLAHYYYLSIKTKEEVFSQEHIIKIMHLRSIPQNHFCPCQSQVLPGLGENRKRERSHNFIGALFSLTIYRDGSTTNPTVAGPQQLILGCESGLLQLL